jgi:hypothetical protein
MPQNIHVTESRVYSYAIHGFIVNKEKEYFNSLDEEKNNELHEYYELKRIVIEEERVSE